MKISRRIDKIRSFKGFFCALFTVFLLLAASEFILQNFTSFGETLNNDEYMASLAFSDEELRTAMKAREDLASLGPRIVGIPGTVVFRYKKARRDSFNFNSFGFRGEEPQKKEENEYRIGVYGDSRVLGFYLAEENTIPFILQKRLRAEFPDRKITVFNIGIEGNDLQREIPFAELESENLELDMAVFYTGGGDVNYSFYKGNDDYKPFTEDEAMDLEHAMLDNIAENKKKPFLQRSAVVKVIKEAFWGDSVQKSASFEKELGLHPLIPEYEARADEFIAKFKSRIEYASGMLARKGIKSVFFYPPFLQLKKPLSTPERNLFYRNEIAVPGLNTYSIRCAKGISESTNPLIFTQSYLFNGNANTMFYDGIHYTPEATRIVGNNVADRMIPLLKKEFAKNKH